MKKIELMHFDKKKFAPKFFFRFSTKNVFRETLLGSATTFLEFCTFFYLTQNFVPRFFLNFRFRQEVNLGVNEAGVAFLTCSNKFYFSRFLAIF